jgi:NAD(P)-dependent dehydrogenase (short-subunit alcohol dehydrogenase family)
VRKQADADRLKAELGEHFTPLVFDVTDGKSVKKAAAYVSAQMHGRCLFGLVNNAGMQLHYHTVNEDGCLAVG